jgi:hypothetical protein
VFGQVSENHDALRAIVIGGIVFFVCLTVMNRSTNQDRSLRCPIPLSILVFMSLFLLIFCQASARRKTSTIAAPNIEILLNN